MATHYVYEDEPDSKTLCQGDVLKRTPDLVAILERYHPHYAKHPDYRYFIVLTQSCDLVRRGKDKECKSRYIAIGAARTLNDALKREAERYQEEWQREAGVIGNKTRSILLMFLSRLLDNNEAGHFYLHEDADLGIHDSCCAVLSLSVTLRAVHYDAILAAKIAQLKDTFQAKLGWLIGNMYSRVGTTEWDREIPDNPVTKESQRVLDETLISIEDEKIKEGIEELGGRKGIVGKPSHEILACIQAKTVLPRTKKFEQRAVEVIKDNKNIKLVNQIAGRASTAIRSGAVLKERIVDLLGESDVTSPDALAEKLIRVFDQRLSEVLKDESLSGRNEMLERFILSILQDTKIAAMLR